MKYRLLFCFDGDLFKRGWTWTPSECDERVSIASEEGCANKSGRLTSPTIALPVHASGYFYRLRIWSRADSRGYWAMIAQAADGCDFIDDCYGSIAPSSVYAETIGVVRHREGAATVRVVLQGGAVDVDSVSLEVIDAEEAARHGDRVMVDLPPLTWKPPVDRWRYMPRTLARLQARERIRVVQLGDSIVNDINNGNWDALVMRNWPGAHLQVIASVRGATGCWLYRDRDVFAELVAKYRPDLLLIGGISNHLLEQTVDPLDDVSVVVRLASGIANCETVLMSGPMDRDWRYHDDNTRDALLPPCPPPPSVPFYGELARISKDMGIGFIDYHEAWNSYLAASGRPWEWFHRDAVHANDRGKQVLARILERWFSSPAC